MTIRKKIKVPLYFSDLIVIQSNNFKKIEEEFSIDSYEDNYSAITFKRNGNVMVAFKNKTNASIIAHEAVHICNHIFKNVGIQLDLDNDEAFAYLLGWVVKQIHKTIKV